MAMSAKRISRLRAQLKRLQHECEEMSRNPNSSSVALAMKTARIEYIKGVLDRTEPQANWPVSNGDAR